MRQLYLSLTSAILLLIPQSAFADTALRAKMNDAYRACAGDNNNTKAMAPTVIARCDKALRTLEGLHSASLADQDDMNWLMFKAGALMVYQSGVYAIENDSKLNKKACAKIFGAEKLYAHETRKFTIQTRDRGHYQKR